jgi:ADP-ribosylation factor related protein 1
MFGLLYGLIKRCRERPELRVLIVGLDNGGKTTLLEQMKSLYLKTSPRKNLKKIPPTVGLNVGRVSYKKWDVLFWDLGGHKSMREIWENYYDDASAILFVIDSADPSRFSEVKKEVERLLSDSRLAGIPILIAANKQDVSNALDPQDVASSAGVHTIQSRALHVQGVSALTCEGISESVDWIMKACVSSEMAGKAPSSMLPKDKV